MNYDRYIILACGIISTAGAAVLALNDQIPLPPVLRLIIVAAVAACGYVLAQKDSWGTTNSPTH